MHHSRGFSLSELLVSLGLLTFAILALLGVFISGLSWMGHSELQSSANQVALEVIEAIRSEGGYSYLPEDSIRFDGRVGDPKVDDFPPDPYPDLLLDGVIYQVVVEVRQHPELVGVRGVRVEVYWGDTGRTVVETAFGG